MTGKKLSLIYNANLLLVFGRFVIPLKGRKLGKGVRWRESLFYPTAYFTLLDL